MNKSRLEAFSDGVFAIIITIMVLELKIPKGTDIETMKALAPQFYCYLLSFSFVGVYWANHHHMMHTARSVNASVIWSNMHLLFWLSLIPFATGWMGLNYFDKITVAVYGGLLLICGISYTILSKVIRKTHHEATELTKALEKSDSKGLVSTVLYASSIPIALFVNPWISEAIFIGVAIMWIVPSKAIEDALENEHK
jgi:TMEM175 potassium channel family protein